MSSSPSSPREASKSSSSHTSPFPTPNQEKFDPTPPSYTTQPQTSPGEAKRIAKLEAKIAALEFQIKETEEKQKGVDGKLKTTEPQATVKAHIKLLHDYNEIRDIGQGLIGIIAENRGARVSEVYKDFDVGEGD